MYINKNIKNYIYIYFLECPGKDGLGAADEIPI